MSSLNSSLFVHFLTGNVSPIAFFHLVAEKRRKKKKEEEEIGKTRLFRWFWSNQRVPNGKWGNCYRQTHVNVCS